MSAVLIAKLIAAGTPAELVAEVAMELGRAQAAADALEQRRRNDRERKAKSRDVAGRHGTGRDTADLSPNENINLTPSQTPNVISNEITPPAENPEDDLKPEHVVEVWNDLATRHGLAAVKKITPERRKKLNTFIRRHSIDDITEAIAAIPRSPFLLGQNGRGWQATFDWFLEPRNVTKLTEGTYAH
jgi:hypothetical protein